MNTKIIAGASAVIAAIFGGGMWISGSDDAATPIVNTAAHGAASAAPAAPADSIIIPELTQIAQSGEIAFNENCAACHGKNAVGTDQGPPLIHKIYEPSHHGDMAIRLAAMNGVRAHHWRFGNMPPVEGITETKIRWITKYIREVQAANGIN